MVVNRRENTKLLRHFGTLTIIRVMVPGKKAFNKSKPKLADFMIGHCEAKKNLSQ